MGIALCDCEDTAETCCRRQWGTFAASVSRKAIVLSMGKVISMLQKRLKKVSKIRMSRIMPFRDQ